LKESALDDFYIVTGSSGSIGKHLTNKLSEFNKVIALSTQSDHFNEFNQNVIPIIFDYKEESINELNTILLSISDEKKFKSVYHCAGSRIQHVFKESTFSEYNAMLDSNFFSLLAITKLTIDHIVSGGSFIVLNSQAAISPSSNEIGYGAAKSAISSFISNMQIEATKRGIQYINVMLGAVNSSMTNNREDKDKLIQLEDLTNFLISLSKLGPSLRVKDIELLRRIY